MQQRPVLFCRSPAFIQRQQTPGGLFK